MNKDTVLDMLSKLADSNGDYRFTDTIRNLVNTIDTTLDHDALIALDQLKTVYPFIGSLSKEAEEERSESILTGAWPGDKGALCIELSLSDSQQDLILNCFATAKLQGHYKHKEHRRFNMMFYFYESDLLRFRLNVSPGKITIIVHKSENSLVSFASEIADLVSSHKEIDYPLVKVAS